jgi:hypothetical protein
MSPVEAYFCQIHYYEILAQEVALTQLMRLETKIKWGLFLQNQPYLMIKLRFILVQTIRKSLTWCSQPYLIRSSASSIMNWSWEYYCMQINFLRRLTPTLIFFWFRDSNLQKLFILQFGFRTTSSMLNRPRYPNWRLPHLPPVTHNFAEAFYEILKLQHHNRPAPKLIR